MEEIKAIRQLAIGVLNLKLTMQNHEIESIVSNCDLALKKLEQQNGKQTIDQRLVEYKEGIVLGEVIKGLHTLPSIENEFTRNEIAKKLIDMCEELKRLK